MKKNWENPEVEMMDVSNTEWTTVDGDVEDNMYIDCNKAYYS